MSQVEIGPYQCVFLPFGLTSLQWFLRPWLWCLHAHGLFSGLPSYASPVSCVTRSVVGPLVKVRLAVFGLAALGAAHAAPPGLVCVSSHAPVGVTHLRGRKVPFSRRLP